MADELSFDVKKEVALVCARINAQIERKKQLKKERERRVIRPNPGRRHTDTSAPEVAAQPTAIGQRIESAFETDDDRWRPYIMADFKRSYAPLHSVEGVYSDDGDDAGGETYRGIAREYHPDWPGWLTIDAAKSYPRFPFTLATNAALDLDVMDFYRQNFWLPIQGDRIISQDIANEMFDSAVNCSPLRAVTWLQESLNKLNRNGELYPDLVTDGAMGQRTLAALSIYLRADGDVEMLLMLMNNRQGNHYYNYMDKSPTQEKYARGWFKRTKVLITA